MKNAPTDLSAVPLDELQALEKGDFSRVSTQTIDLVDRAEQEASMKHQNDTMLKSLFVDERNIGAAYPDRARVDFMESKGLFIKSREANINWAAERLKDHFTHDQVLHHWDTIRPALAQYGLGIQDKPEINDEQLWLAIRQNYQDQDIGYSAEFMKADPVDKVLMAGRMVAAGFGTAFEGFWENYAKGAYDAAMSSFTGFEATQMPTGEQAADAWVEYLLPGKMKKSFGSGPGQVPLPDMREMGIANPALIGGTVNVMKSVWDSILSPAGVTLGVFTMGTETAAQAGSIFAAKVMMNTHRLFALQMGAHAAAMTPDTFKKLKDPDAPFQEVFEAVGGQVVTSMFALSAALGWAHSKSRIQTQQKMLDAMQQATAEVKEAMFRRLARESNDAIERRALEDAADELAKMTKEEQRIAQFANEKRQEAALAEEKAKAAMDKAAEPSEKWLKESAERSAEMDRRAANRNKPLAYTPEKFNSGMEKEWTTLRDLIGKQVTYLGYVGKLIRDTEGNVVILREARADKNTPALVEIADAGKNMDRLAHELGLEPEAKWFQPEEGSLVPEAFPSQISKDPLSGKFTVTDGEGNLVLRVETEAEALKVADEVDAQRAGQDPFAPKEEILTPEQKVQATQADPGGKLGTEAPATTTEPLKNSVTDAQRAEAGKPPTSAPEVVTDEAAAKVAEEAFKKDPGVGEKLVDELSVQMRGLSKERGEIEILAEQRDRATAHLEELRRELGEAEKRGDVMNLDRLQLEFEQANKYHDLVTRLSRETGTESARGLQGRRAAQRDMSFAGIKRHVEAGGGKMDPADVATSRMIADALDKIMKEKAAATERDQLERDRGEAPAKRKALFLESLSRKAEAAKQRMNERFINSGGVASMMEPGGAKLAFKNLPDAAADIAIIATDYLARAIADGRDISFKDYKWMVQRDVGPLSDKMLRDTWRSANGFMGRGGEIAPTYGIRLLLGMERHPDLGQGFFKFQNEKNNPVKWKGSEAEKLGLIGMEKDPVVMQIAADLNANHDVPNFDSWETATPAQNRKLARLIVSEVIHAYTMHPESAGWYKANTTLAKDIILDMDPSLKDPTNMFVFDAVLAVASQGNLVGPNFEMAYDTYKAYRDSPRTGKAIKVKGDHVWGKDVAKIRANIDKINYLVKKLGAEKARDWLMREGTVAEFRQSLIDDLGIDPKKAKKIGTGELTTEKVPFALLFGPKLGSFFHNLNGDYTPITMDMWFMRTIGRLTGTLMNKPGAESIAKGRDRVHQAFKKMSAEELKRLGLSKRDFTAEKIDQTARAIERKSGKKEWRDALSESGHELRKAGKMLVEKMDGKINEVPKSGGQRSWMRRIFLDVQDQLKAQGIHLENADLQALLWYGEKELYESYGYKGDPAADYGAAANAVYVRELGRPSQRYESATGRVGEIGRGDPQSGNSATLGPGRGLVGRLVDFLGYDAALKRTLKAVKEGRIYSIGPEELYDMTVIAAHDLAAKSVDAVRWSADMIRRFGPEVKPHLAEIWDGAKTIIKNERIEARRRSYYEQRAAKGAEVLARGDETGDYSSPPRNPLAPSPEVMKLQREANRIWQQVAEMRQRADEQVASKLDKAVEYFNRVETLFAISGYHTLAKLASISLQRLAESAVMEAAGAGLSKVPGLKDVYEKSSMEGGYSAESIKRFYSDFWGKGMKDAFEQLTTGTTENKAYYDGPSPEVLDWIDWIGGNSHTAMKTPLRTGTFAMLLEKSAIQAKKHGLDIDDPAVRYQIGKAAWDYSLRAILQEPNRFSNWVKAGVGRIESPSVRAFVGIMEALTTKRIYKVPANYVWQTLERSPAAFVKVAGDAAYRKINKIELTPEEADVTSRLITAGFVGTAFFVWGFSDAFRSDRDKALGGYYTKTRKSSQDVPVGSIRAGDLVLPHFLTHNPLTESAQVGNTMGRMMRKHMEKNPNEPPAVLESAMAGFLGVTSQAPMVSTIVRIEGQSLDEWLKSVIKSILVPQFMNNLATDLDREDGKAVKRKTEDVKDAIKSGVPGLRQTLPKKVSSIQRDPVTGRITGATFEKDGKTVTVANAARDEKTRNLVSADITNS